jgi:hypothetical protein
LHRHPQREAAGMLKGWSDKEPDPPMPLWRKVALYEFVAASVPLVVLQLANLLYSAFNRVFSAF